MRFKGRNIATFKKTGNLKPIKNFCEPGCTTAIKHPLRRTLQLQEHC